MKKSFLKFTLAIGLTMITSACSSTSTRPVSSEKLAATDSSDPNLWLEAVESPEALAWVKAQNDKSLPLLKSHPAYAPIQKEIRRVVLAKDRIPYPKPMGNWVYNFWQDQNSVHGLWRRMPLQNYLKKSNKWETVLDLDKLSKDESENWVWKGSSCLPPNFDRCLLHLSRGGKDAQVTREFDTVAKKFVKDGFLVPEARSSSAWVDRDTLLVGTDWGPGTLAPTGFPRIIKSWTRGTPLSTAKFVFEGDIDDISTYPFVIWDTHRKLVGVGSGKTFYSSTIRLFDKDNKLVKIPLPEDHESVDLFQDHLLVTLKSNWTVGTKTFIAGSIVSVDASDLQNLKPKLVWQPTERSSMSFVSTSKNDLLIGTLNNVNGEVLRASFKNSSWKLTPLPLPLKGSISLISSSAFSPSTFVTYESFLTPPTLYHITDLTKPVAVRQLPGKFDAKPFVIDQLEATSKDGTKVPYFVVRKQTMPFDGSNPTLLYGYGGFNISQEPFYSPTVGTAWLNRGGVYVLSNIRGGGEFGPKWHKAALLENRHKAFEDFIAIAEDLMARKITSKDHLGIMGGSNGGLLVGAAMTMRPELFKAVVCQVPLLDMLRYHQLLAGKLWVAEFGSPEDPIMAKVLRSYSPYQNLQGNAKYPRPFLVTSTKDDRVHPGHARKMVAKMMAQGHPVLYYENTNGGHAAAANLEERIHRTSLEYTYLVDELFKK